MKKTFVLDTNVLLTDPNSIFNFEDNDIVIPIGVIEELDKFKKDMSETGRNAREFSRILDRLRDKGILSQGLPLNDRGGTLTVYINKATLPTSLEDTVDNQLIAVATHLQTYEVPSVLVTNDANVRIKADAFGVRAESYESDRVDMSEFHSGPRKILLDNDQETEFQLKGQIAADNLNCNQYVAVKGPLLDTYGQFDNSRGIIREVPIAKEVWGIKARNAEQNIALDALLNDNIKLVTLSGGAGTGKTLMAIAAGLSKVADTFTYHKLLVARPIFPLGKDIGFLPGDLNEKLNPWMQPIYDNLELLLGNQSNREELAAQGMLQVEPLTYIRGRSLPNVFFIVDEAQNLTPHEVKTILTRAGDNTKIILTGDPGQIDNPYLDASSNGLTYVIDRFKNEPLAAHVQLIKGERSDLATVAAKLL